MTEFTQEQVNTALAAVKLVTVAAGLYIVYLGGRAYRKNRQQPILWLTIGMLILTIGAVSEGMMLQGLGWTPNQSHVAESFVTLLGFLVLVYSLRVR